MTEEREKPILITKSKNKKVKIFYVVLAVLIVLLSWRLSSHINQVKKAEGQEDGQDGKKKAVIKKSIIRELIVATTFSLEDSGLLNFLVPEFERLSGYRVKVLAVGTGEALEMGRRQVADVLLVHAPEMEEKFMAAGYGERREMIMASDFVIAGPESDPVGIKNLNFVDAFLQIARKKYFFVSRADNSGTNFLEKQIWKSAGIKPEGRWYLETGQGMAESLRIASEKQAYILVDLPTFMKLSRGIELAILATDSQYQNLYSVITVKNLSGKVNEKGGQALLEYLTSEKAQRLIVEFNIEARKSREQDKQNQEGKQSLYYPLRLRTADSEESKAIEANLKR